MVWGVKLVELVFGCFLRDYGNSSAMAEVVSWLLCPPIRSSTLRIERRGCSMRRSLTDLVAHATKPVQQRPGIVAMERVHPGQGRELERPGTAGVQFLAPGPGDHLG